MQPDTHANEGSKDEPAGISVSVKLECEIVTREPARSRSESRRSQGTDEVVCELALTPVPASVRVGRQFAARMLTEWDVPPEPIQDAVLIVSELVTNAICHGCPPVTLRMRKARHELAIEVDDGDDSVPRARGTTHDSLNGRGLPIVAALSSSWTADLTDSGKTVRSVLTVSA